MSASDAAPWRSTLLVYDETPSAHAELYRAWEEHGASIDVETGFVELLARIRNSARKYHFVLIPVSAFGTISHSGVPAWEILDGWAQQHAPGYRGRFVYYGPTVLMGRRIPAAQQKQLALPLLNLPLFPPPQSIRRATEEMGTLIERRLAGRGRGGREAEEAEDV
jgi:hypothetical protein